MADPDALIRQTVSHYRIIGVGVCLQADGALRCKMPGKYFVFDCSEHTIADSIDTSPPARSTIEDVKGGRGISAVA